MTHKLEILQATVDFQPLAQPLSTDVADFVTALQHTRECSQTPPLPLPASPQQISKRPKQMPHKLEILQATVDFQTLAQPLSTDVADFVTVLQHTRECSQTPPLPLPALQQQISK